MVSSYQDFKSDYKVDAHILYLYAKQGLLIQSYWDNYDNHESYGQKFADRHKSSIVEHLTDLDPNNKGVILSSDVLWNLKQGMNSFFNISEQNWKNIYNEKDVDWIEVAKSEAEKNSTLREMNPKIGMSNEEVIKTKWGRPEKVNRTTTSYGVREQWVYPDYKYLYFEDGILTTIQD